MCEREPINTSDRYTVAVKKEGTFALKTVAGVFAVLRQGDAQSQVWVSSMNTWNGTRYNSHRNVLIIPCRKNLLQKIFHTIIFCSLMRIRKLFNNENFPIYGMFNFTLHVCAEIFHVVSIDVLASVSAPSLDTTRESLSLECWSWKNWSRDQNFRWKKWSPGPIFLVKLVLPWKFWSPEKHLA